MPGEKNEVQDAAIDNAAPNAEMSSHMNQHGHHMNNSEDRGGEAEQQMKMTHPHTQENTEDGHQMMDHHVAMHHGEHHHADEDRLPEHQMPEMIENEPSTDEKTHQMNNHQMHHHPSKKVPFYVSVLIGVTHCGAGCILGDIVGEWIVYGTNVTINGRSLWPEFLIGTDSSLTYVC